MSRLRRANARLWQALDWRYVASLAAVLFVAMIIAVLTTNADARRDAVSSRDQTAAAASRRIDLLNERIQELSEQVVVAQSQNAELIAKVDALAEQVSQMGGRPVVQPTSSVSSRPSSTSTAPAADKGSSGLTPTTQPQPEPGPPSPPPTPPTTQPPCRGLTVPLVGCVG